MRIIEIPQWGTVTLIEALWLCSGMLAFFLASMRMPALVHDFRYAKGIGESDFCIIARGYLRREVIRMTQALCVVSIGLYAAWAAPVVAGPARVSIVGLILTGVLIAISLLIALQSFFDWRDREHIIRIVGGERMERESHG